MNNNDKIRLLYLAKVLKERTDENHVLTTNQLIRVLKDEYGINTHRQTMGTEMELLRDFGMDIRCIHSTQNKYYLGTRDFDLAELKLISDAVGSCKFISRKECKTLSEKLAAQTSDYQAEALKRNVSASDRVRTTNDKVCRIIDAVNAAINQKCKLSFLYFTYSPKKKKVLKNDGEPYVLSPYSLIWDGDRYYMVGWSDKHDELRTFRIDRIYEQPVLLEDEKARRAPKGFHAGKFADTCFHMFNGQVQTVTLLCENDTMDSMISRFGEKVKTEIADDGHFRLHADIAASHIFYSWIFGFRGKVRIEAPEEVKKEYRKMVRAEL